MDEPLFNLYGFNWRLGRKWGVAHPKDICYNSADTIEVGQDDVIHLGIKYEPQEFVFDGVPKLYPYSVGYISSIETIKYGHLTVDFKLPIGMHLWPAVWLTDVNTWPPEIDIMEAWSGCYEWLVQPKSPKKIYRANWLANKIYPGVVLGTCVEEKHGKSYRTFRGSMACYLDTEKVNRCELDWREDRLQVWYNGHKVADEKDPEVLKYFNDSEGMEIHLNNYVSNDFTDTDLNEINTKKDDGYTSDFQILNLVYEK